MTNETRLLSVCLTKSGHRLEPVIVHLSLNDDKVEFDRVYQGIHLTFLFFTLHFICTFVRWAWCDVFLSSPLCCAALSPGWESSCVPLWDVFDFTTRGETFHLLIFPGVWGCNRLCKHILIHHQLHNRLQSFLIPLKSLWTTMKMNFFFSFFARDLTGIA